jgi:hypothetical protein
VDVRRSHPQRLAGNEGRYVVRTAKGFTLCSKCLVYPPLSQLTTSCGRWLVSWLRRQQRSNQSLRP